MTHENKMEVTTPPTKEEACAVSQDTQDAEPQ